MPSNHPSTPRFEDITETTGGVLTREAASMMQTRYAFASGQVAGQRVLELGCGAGLGLGMIQRAGARLVVGGDYSLALLRSARSHYRERVPLVRLSAMELPLAPRSFDVVVFYEATYYIPDMDAAFREIARILSANGTLLIVSANPERPDFIPSPHSTHYHTAAEFRQVLRAHGFETTVGAAYPVLAADDGWARRSASLALRVARSVLLSLGLVPRTLKGRARLKRLLYGRMIAVPAELPDNFAPEVPRSDPGDGPVTGFKVLYVQAIRRMDARL